MSAIAQAVDAIERAREELAEQRDSIDARIASLDMALEVLDPAPVAQRPASRAKANEAARAYAAAVSEAITEPHTAGPPITVKSKVHVATPTPKIGKRTIKPVECPDCHETLGSAQGLASHRKRFHVAKPVPVNEGGAIAPAVPVADSRAAYRCEHCGARFDVLEQCVAHEGVCDDRPARVVDGLACPECGHLCLSPAGLGAHRKNKHGVSSAAVVARGDAPPPIPAAKAPVQQLSGAHLGHLVLRCQEDGCTFTCRSSMDIENHARSNHGRRSLPAERTPVTV